MSNLPNRGGHDLHTPHGSRQSRVHLRRHTTSTHRRGRLTRSPDVRSVGTASRGARLQSHRAHGRPPIVLWRGFFLFPQSLCRDHSTATGGDPRRWEWSLEIKYLIASRLVRVVDADGARGIKSRRDASLHVGAVLVMSEWTAQSEVIRWCSSSSSRVTWRRGTLVSASIGLHRAKAVGVRRWKGLCV